LQSSREELNGDDKSHPVIGVVFEHITSTYGLELMYHLDRAATKKGYKVCYRFSYTDQSKETEEIDFLLSLGVCGLIIMPSHGEHYNTKILKLVLDGFPVVLIDKSLEGIPVPAVYTDNDRGAGMLVDYLVDNGYTNIGLVSSGYTGISSLEERKKGFYERMAAHALKVNEACIAELRLDAIDSTGKSTAERNVKTISQYLKKYPSLDSLICLENGFPSDIYEACRRSDLKIPDDLAVCSFDEDYSSSRGYFFTHIKQDEVSIAEKSLELIDRLIRKDGEVQIKNYKIPGLFREGQTVKPKKK
jgi:GntR family transcriptional regulator of arabinose operon